METSKTTLQRIICRSNEEWRRERSHSVGASAVGVIIGESPFMTPMELAYKMRAELRGEYDWEQTPAMRIGHAFEGGVAQLFEEETGHKVIAASSREYLLRRSDIPFMHASPDRTYWIDENGLKHGKNSGSNKGILECKTTRISIDSDELPPSWIFQLQTQMGIAGVNEGAIAWFVLPTSTFGYKYFTFDREIFAASVMVCKDFWERCVVGGEDPEPVSVKDYVRLWPKHTVGKTMTVSKNVMDVIEEIKEMKGVYDQLEAEINSRKDMLRKSFTDEEAMVDIDGHVLATYKTNARGTRTLLIK